jgi:pimeloyl-ACP methyl ester carboxylesterase
MFAARFLPGGTHDQADYFNDLQLKTTSPECATRYFDVTGDIDIIELLPKVKAPTLVMHARDDGLVPFEAGRQLAAGIPHARFIALPGRNHLFLEHEPASNRFFEEINLFLRGWPDAALRSETSALALTMGLPPTAALRARSATTAQRRFQPAGMRK